MQIVIAPITSRSSPQWLSKTIIRNILLYFLLLLTPACRVIITPSSTTPANNLLLMRSQNKPIFLAHAESLGWTH